MGRRQEWPFVLLFRMDFTCFFREREGAHLVIRSWAEMAASGSLAPRLDVSPRPRGPGVAVAPAARLPQMVAIQRPSCPQKLPEVEDGWGPAFHLFLLPFWASFIRLFPSEGLPSLYMCACVSTCSCRRVCSHKRSTAMPRPTGVLPGLLSVHVPHASSR